MSDTPPSKSGSWIAFVAALGGFSIFGLILLVAYLPKKPVPLAEGQRTPEQRKTALAELRAKEQSAATTYAWIDQGQGVVRLPIEEAMRLTLQELSAK